MIQEPEDISSQSIKPYEDRIIAFDQISEYIEQCLLNSKVVGETC